MRRLALFAALALALAGCPAAFADETPPVLWAGRIVDANGHPADAEVVAYARPAGGDLQAPHNTLVEIARATTDSSGRYSLHAGYGAALHEVEDESGWANVMVVAFGEDGGVTMAVDSVAWQPSRPHARPNVAAIDAGRWVTAPAERITPSQGGVRVASAPARNSDSRERPAVMTLSRPDAKISAMAVPPPSRQAGYCVGPFEIQNLGVHYTPIGEIHVEQQWNGQFEYTTTKSSSFQVGYRHQGGRWSAAGSTSSVKHEKKFGRGNKTLPGGRMYTFSGDMTYKRFTWNCNRAETWTRMETVEAVEWGGRLRRTDDRPAPNCNRKYLYPIDPQGGYFYREHGTAVTYEGAVSVLGFHGSMTSTMADGVFNQWDNQADRERHLCGATASIYEDTRIRSLP